LSPNGPDIIETEASNQRQAHADRGRREGGHIKRAWQGAIRRVELDPELTPHDLRHSWASWHYALHRDLVLLKVDGEWSSVTLVERYAHLMPAGQETAIRAFWHLPDTKFSEKSQLPDKSCKNHTG